MGDRVAVMKDGLLQQCDTPKRLFSRPANAFVAGFIGSPAMNLLRGALTVDGVRLGTFDVPLSPEQRAALSGPEVLVGLRPEALVPVPGDRPGMPVVVDVVEELGSDTYLYCSTPETEGDLGASRAITVRRDATSDHVGGEQLNLQPQLHAVHLFDAVTGRRLPDAVVPALALIARTGFEPFPLSRWSSPALTGFGRLPMAPALDPFDDGAAAQSGAPSPWVRSLDGRWQFRLVDDPDQVTVADVGTDRADRRVGRARGARSVGAAGSRRADLPEHPDAVRRSRADRAGRATRPGCTAARSPCPTPWRGRRTPASHRCGRLDGAGCGSTARSSGSARTAASRRRSTSPTPSRARRQRPCASWSRVGVDRAGSRTRTSGGSPVCTAASSWCRYPWNRSPTRRLVPGLDADGTTGTLDHRRRGRRRRPRHDRHDGEGAHRRGRRRDDRPAAGRPPPAPTAVPQFDFGDPMAMSSISAYRWPGHRVTATIRVPAIEAWTHETPAPLPRRRRSLRDRRARCSTCARTRSASVGSRSPTASTARSTASPS